MRKIIILIILFLLCLNLNYGQVRTVDTLKDPIYKRDCSKLKISYPPNDTNEFFFRYSDESQYVDIWTSNFKVFNGLITNYAIKLKYKDFSINKEKLFIKKIEIDTSKARQIYKMIISDTVFNILLQENEKRIDTGIFNTVYYDGTFFDFELSTKKIYRNKWYENDGRHDTLTKTRLAINLFKEKLRTSLNLDDIYKKFYHKLPYGNYQGQGFGVIMHSRKLEKHK